MLKKKITLIFYNMLISIIVFLPKKKTHFVMCLYLFFFIYNLLLINASVCEQKSTKNVYKHNRKYKDKCT